MPDLTGLGGLKLDTALLPKSIDVTALKQRTVLPDLATTGSKETTFVVPYAGVLADATLATKDALAASDTNYLTFTLVNRGTGGGSTAMLAATAANTTQATGGSAITAYTKRTLTLHGTAGNLVVAAGDVLSFNAAATGTLAGAVTGVSLTLTITPS